ncbi:MAG: radical SAM family heme chaperone HemW, partial [Candidatus Competibacteraceae bacterium]|nr:radical SAM family heme chaperone HemW [Candidatus Competibacteraceae bacterium]
MLEFTVPIPLSLYIHIPWCVRKCPYCDFNSHALRDTLPEADYVAALLADLEQDLPRVWGRPVESVFIGGGTPSLFSPWAIDRLLSGLRARLNLRPDLEITLEANPGTVEQDRFIGYRQAGINRLSIGVQSFNPVHLQGLGRIHGPMDAIQAAEAARRAGFDDFNLDLMYGLPGQSVEQALADLDQALALEPTHLSHYQLTLEPNTLFYRYPPPLPQEEQLWAIQEACQERLASSGYRQYEISAYARSERRCRHNLNYWTFGDYLGIGAGAHGKLSDPATGEVLRMWKVKHPRDYLARAGRPEGIGGLDPVEENELGLEFMLNALRLVAGVPAALFSQRCALPLTALEPALSRAREQGLLVEDPRR